ncbi:hypothetical protein [Allorhizocola rhizosphaerae]|nr:hypothetical protein [Allorhizocola rhizosphaerae]
MTAFVIFVLFVAVLGVAGNLGWIKSNSDPDHPEGPFIRQS